MQPRWGWWMFWRWPRVVPQSRDNPGRKDLIPLGFQNGNADGNTASNNLSLWNLSCINLENKTIQAHRMTITTYRPILFLLLIVLHTNVKAQFIYTTNSDSSINISAYIGSGGAVIIPDSANLHGANMPVTSIGIKAFQGNGTITSLTIGTNITSIRDYAFNTCYQIGSIIVPDNVTEIGKLAFFGCRNATNISIGSYQIKLRLHYWN